MNEHLHQFIHVRAELQMTLNQFPADHREVVLFNKWSLKDVLAHIIGWEVLSEIFGDRQINKHYCPDISGGLSMHTKIFYYTGTGNSLWVSRMLSNALGNTELLAIADVKSAQQDIKTDRIGLIFPVYIWGLPAPIIDVVNTFTSTPPAYLFAVAVNGGQVANTLIQLKKLMAHKNLTLAAGWQITMPSNYIPWGGAAPKEEQERLFAAARDKITQIASAIQTQTTAPVEKGPLWHRIAFTPMYHLSFRQVPKMDGKFWVDTKCNQCGICEKVCPAANITLSDGKPVWNHRCEQCFACLQWCPQTAIQYGKNTPKYERYHHPEVTLKDVLHARPER